MSKEKEKFNAAKSSLENIKDGMVVGIGSGSTVAILIELLGKKIREEKMDILTVPTSYQVQQLLIKEKLSITTLDEHPDLDIAIDGADEVNENLDLIKGGGAALTREKIVDSCTDNLIIIVDSSKLVEKIGEQFRVPIEIIPMALPLVKKKLKALSNDFKLRMAEKKLGPVITDNGNFIIDVKISDLSNKNLKEVEKNLNSIPGVVENGLFIDMTKLVYVGYENKTEKLIEK
ncbi:MAG: ribose 5-phosphate isomerase A [Candidatus Lokiarchaeota archaeon]|nr:ribose 5-phosphate isomerase A [Candidatus Lokiarchaeota archaeon]